MQISTTTTNRHLNDAHRHHRDGPIYPADFAVRELTPHPWDNRPLLQRVFEALFGRGRK